MVQIFQSSFVREKFEDLYRVLLPDLNKCGNCGFTKCFRCNHFDHSCDLCKQYRCEHCVKFINSIKFFYENAKDEEWDYFFNFLHDLFESVKPLELTLQTFVNL